MFKKFAMEFTNFPKKNPRNMSDEFTMELSEEFTRNSEAIHGRTSYPEFPQRKKELLRGSQKKIRGNGQIN